VSEAMKLVLNEDKNEVDSANLHHSLRAVLGTIFQN
jgi:hypothetical protein